jgi:CubicO group peptidase (beta-lactamase class C family)
MSESELKSAIVLELAEEFLARYRQGERPPLKEYIDRHPHLAAEIREVFPAMAMMERVALADASLADPVDKWLPAFKNPRLADGGKAARAPTVRELLAHRGGVFSQKEGISLRQSRLIRDWRQTLADSTAAIAAEPLIAQPGERHAYSGAGYCVAGRVVEIATGADFDRLLREILGSPLGLKRTGYFVDKGDANVAVGGQRQGDRIVPHPATPHLLGDAHRFVLVGGSIYSTAGDVASFARMVLAGGGTGDIVVLPADTAQEFIKPQFTDQRYGLGWILETGPGDKVTRLLHNSALAAYRGVVQIDLDRGLYIVVLVTLVHADDEAEGFIQTIQPLARQTLVGFSAKRKK